MNRFKQITKLKFELNEFHPELSDEVRGWLYINNINFDYIFNRYGAAIYDRAYLYFETLEDAMAFKLRWL